MWQPCWSGLPWASRLAGYPAGGSSMPIRRQRPGHTTAMSRARASRHRPARMEAHLASSPCKGLSFPGCSRCSSESCGACMTARPGNNRSCACEPCFGWRWRVRVRSASHSPGNRSAWSASPSVRASGRSISTYGQLRPATIAQSSPSVERETRRAAGDTPGAWPGSRTRSAAGRLSKTSGGSSVMASPSTPISTGPPESMRNRGVVHSCHPENLRIWPAALSATNCSAAGHPRCAQ